MKRLKKVLSLTLIFALLMTSIPVGTFAQTNEANTTEVLPENLALEGEVVSGSWSNEGYYDISWYDDNPTAIEYVLETASELAGLAVLVDNGIDFVDVTIKLAKDVDLSGNTWNPIGSYSSESNNKPFKGTFDGQNNEILGLNASGNYSALFGYISGNVTIKNLVMKDVKVCGEQYVAAVAAYADAGTGEVIVDNCYVDGAITEPDFDYENRYSAGIIGYLNAQDGTATIRNCEIHCSVSNTRSTGGVIGYAAGNSQNYIRIENCHNYSNVIGGSDSECCGGIAGYASNVKFLKCSNYGGIYGNSTSDDDGSLWHGGIAGYGFSMTFEDCANYGEIKAWVVGGLTASSSHGLVAKNCLNAGTLTHMSTPDGDGYALFYNGSFENCFYVSGEMRHTSSEVERVTAEQLASGEICYRLNGSRPIDELVWGQNLDNGNVQAYPVIGGAPVYEVEGGYSNTNKTGYIATGKCGDNLKWVLFEDGTLKLSGTGAMYNYQANGAPWVDYKNILTNLVLEEGITSIGNYAFYGCSGLAGDLVIPEGVESVGSQSFSGCCGLTGNLVLPESLITINFASFSECSGLTGSLTLSNNLQRIDAFAFYNCSGFTGDLVIPDNIKDIEPCTFQGCTGLDGELLMSENVSSAGEDSFTGVRTTMVVPAASANAGFLILVANDYDMEYEVTGISVYGYEGVYDGVEHGINVDAPEDVIITYATSIGGTYSETNPKYEKVGMYTTYYKVTKVSEMWGTVELMSGSEEIKIIPAGLMGVTASGYEGYYDNNAHHITVTAPEGAKITYSTNLNGEYTTFNPTFVEVGTYTVYYKVIKDNYIAIEGSETVTILLDPNILEYGKCGDDLNWTLYKDGTLEISGTGEMYNYWQDAAPWYAKYSDSIKTLRLEEGITYIGNSAFERCKNLTGTLIIPKSVTGIGEWAFSDCSGFTGSLILPGGLEKIGACAFNNCSGFTGNLVLPNSLTKIDTQAFNGCFGFTGELVIPNGITVIESYTFDGCSGFDGNLVLPDKLTEIGADAFNECSGLSGNLVLPQSLTKIGYGAFIRCSNLTGNLVLPSNLTELGGWAFLDCSGFNGNLVIPNGVTIVEEFVFKGCTGLDGDLVLTEDITEIGPSAFEETKLVAVIPYDAENADYLLQYASSNGLKYKITGIGAESYEGVYDGNAHSITVNAPTGSSITYSTSKNGQYSAINPAFTKAGEYTVYYKVTKDNVVLASGSAVVNIEAKSIAAMIANLEYDTVVYDGGAKTPKATLDGLTMSDFKVTYTENINVGEATVIITGIGNYTDTITKNFTIEPKSIEGMEAVLEYNYVNCDGTAKTPAVTIEGLTSADFEVAYANNIEVGIATVTIIGTGNYTGVITKTFEIEAGIMGDVNNDGIVNTVDASIVISYYYGNVDFDETQMRLADVNGDGVISTVDASMIISYYYGNINSFA